MPSRTRPIEKFGKAVSQCSVEVSHHSLINATIYASDADMYTRVPLMASAWSPNTRTYGKTCAHKNS